VFVACMPPHSPPNAAASVAIGELPDQLLA
jgi:hypothetical protein